MSFHGRFSSVRPFPHVILWNFPPHSGLPTGADNTPPPLFFLWFGHLARWNLSPERGERGVVIGGIALQSFLVSSPCCAHHNEVFFHLDTMFPEKFSRGLRRGGRAVRKFSLPTARPFGRNIFLVARRGRLDPPEPTFRALSFSDPSPLWLYSPFNCSRRMRHPFFCTKVLSIAVGAEFFKPPFFFSREIPPAPVSRSSV